MAGQIRVGFVSHSAGRDGAEKALLELLDGLLQRQIECFVALPCVGHLTEELRARHVPVKVVPFRWWAVGERGVRFWKRAWRVLWNVLMAVPLAGQLAKWNVSVVYTNTAVIPTGALAALLLRKPHIWHIHEFVEEDHGYRFDLGSRLSLWLISCLSDYVITNSYAVQRKFGKYVPEGKQGTIYYGFDVRDSGPVQVFNDGDAQSGSRAVIVGQVSSKKGQMDAIYAVEELVAEGISVALTVIGQDDKGYAEQVKRYVRERGLEKHVEFEGYLADPSEVVRRSQVALMCSRFEAFGRVTVEAMLLGKPVIGVRSGGTEELIRDHFNGLLYRAGDSHELAQKIKYVVTHPDLARQMGENGRRWCEERFKFEEFPRQVREVIQKVV